MHETGIVKDLVHRMEKAAAEAGAKRVARAQVWIGALSQFSPEHFREHFSEEVQGTLAQDTILDLEISDDVLHPDAQHVVVRSIDLEV